MSTLVYCRGTPIENQTRIAYDPVANLAFPQQHPNSRWRRAIFQPEYDQLQKIVYETSDFEKIRMLRESTDLTGESRISGFAVRLQGITGLLRKSSDTG